MLFELWLSGPCRFGNIDPDWARFSCRFCITQVIHTIITPRFAPQILSMMRALAKRIKWMTWNGRSHSGVPQPSKAWRSSERSFQDIHRHSPESCWWSSQTSTELDSPRSSKITPLNQKDHWATYKSCWCGFSGFSCHISIIRLANTSTNEPKTAGWKP